LQLPAHASYARAQPQPQPQLKPHHLGQTEPARGGDPMSEVQFIERDAVRAILLTPAHEVLLLRVRPPDGRESFWVTPGGGMNPGEDVRDCLRRELREELGIEQFALGPLVWRRQHTFNWAGRRICQHERYHVVDVEKFVPRMLDPVESEVIDCLRWWSVGELSSTRERLVPLSLADIMAKFIRDGAPTGPLAVEVLVD
jgi:8-oxo-dGTP pyrophosphatase MutT (NUDIX family)